MNMKLKKEYASTLIKILEADLDEMKRMSKTPDAIAVCIQWSEEMVDKFKKGDLDIDGAMVGYLDTVLFNHMPQSIEEYQDMVNVQVFMAKNTEDMVYPIKYKDDLVQAFLWAREEGKGLKLYITRNSYATNPDIDVIHNTNLNSKLKYYEEKYEEYANKSDDDAPKFRIAGYSLF